MLTLTGKTRYRRTLFGKLVLQVEVAAYGDTRMDWPPFSFVDAHPNDLEILEKPVDYVV